jgi:hypothetical protein
MIDDPDGEDRYKELQAAKRSAMLLAIEGDAKAKLQGWENLKFINDVLRNSVRYNLGEALEDPVRGSEWDVPLRLIARFHVMYDINAPALFRVNRQFEYCWRLAVKTTEIDLHAQGKKPKTPDYNRRLYVYKSRRAKIQDAWLANFHAYGATPLGQGEKVKQVQFAGTTEVVVPPEANAVGPESAVYNLVHNGSVH